MLRIISTIWCALCVVSACVPDTQIINCFDVAKNPEAYRDYGRCTVHGELEFWKQDYILRASDGVHFVFIGDIQHLWSKTFYRYVGKPVEITGRYKLLDGQYLTIKEIEHIYPPVSLVSK